MFYIDQLHTSSFPIGLKLNLALLLDQLRLREMIAGGGYD